MGQDEWKGFSVADAKTETSKSSSPTNVISAPTRRTTGTEEIPVDTTQNYDPASEPKGLGEAGFKKAGDPAVVAPRHQDRA